MDNEIVVDFGQYEGVTAKELFLIDPKYCQWIIRQSGFKRTHPDLVSILIHFFDENPNVLNYDTLEFGPYYGMKIADFISDKNYCRWLINKHKTFKYEYPEMYNELAKMYDLYYGGKYIYLYVLCFKDEGVDYIKIGKTNQFIVRRMYNYIYGYLSGYSGNNVDWSKSFVYKTNRLSAEKDLFLLLDKYRLNQREEKFHLKALTEIHSEIQKLAIDKYYFNKKMLSDFIPFIDGNAWKDCFYVPINAFQDFERMYLELLDCLGLKSRYNPDFIVCEN